MTAAITQIIAAKRQIPPQDMRHVYRAASKYSIALDSLMWLLLESYPDGSRRSRNYIDAPQCVAADGLIKERFAAGIAPAGWALTDKGSAILAAVRAG
ncbi:MAG: hypothetical protein EBS50_13045 [Sphingomonadaceae bacterium]|nr:hypothetical protein [Sphingomonadaceae bacterium]